MPIVEEHKESGSLLIVGKRQQIDYSLHPSIVGEMFRPEEFQMEPLNPLEPSSSGVCVFGLNDGCDRLEAIRSLAWFNEYFIEAELGRGTHLNSIRGTVNSRMEYDHVSQHQLSTLLSLLRLQYKKASFEFANLNMQSQQAFELARRGAPRPRVLGSPLIFGLDLCYFKLPYFKLNIQINGETDQFLCDFIHEIGLNLSTVASTRKLRRTRQGFFGIEHALLDKHFHLESVLKNILMCEKILAKNLEENLNCEIIELNEDNEKEKNLENENLPELEDCLKLPFGREYKIC
uniref:Pseudouridine synthase II N-terminal domain-containing protein n=1 Tax=Meloidogyne incognita TaxID=6306 RepID=A0A914N445_MELIC